METESFHPEGTAIDFTGKADDLQKGFMAIIRSVAKPETF